MRRVPVGLRTKDEMSELNHVRAAISRPPSGFALEQTAAAEQVIGAARACVAECRVRVSPEHHALLVALERLDAASVPFNREVQSSDAGRLF